MLSKISIVYRKSRVMGFKKIKKSFLFFLMAQKRRLLNNRFCMDTYSESLVVKAFIDYMKSRVMAEYFFYIFRLPS